RVLLQSDRILKRFRGRFTGKCSPVHYFWGGPDLAVTRFSGRPAPEHPGGVPHLSDRVVREAYSQEVISCGFWPGGVACTHAPHSAYASPAPPGFAEARVEPAAAFFSKELGEFLLPYEEVRRADSPEDLLLAFFQSAYEAAADLAGWDREGLERRIAFYGPT